MSNADGYRWKNFRGARWTRPSYTGTWYGYASGSWKVFEFLDMCEAAKIRCVVTLNNAETPEDMADLVEYAHGNASTQWGAQRVADGQHPAPYQPFMTEIGNEQVGLLEPLCVAWCSPLHHTTLLLLSAIAFGTSPTPHHTASIIQLCLQCLDTRHIYASSICLL
jgi:alpha-L-arabinofuranosidase